LGLQIKAVCDSPETASILGIRTDYVRATAYGYASILVSLAAAINVGYAGISPGVGTSELLMAAISVQVGGIASMTGSFLGGYLLGLGQSLGVWRLPSQWQNAFAFLVLAVFLLIKPRGLFGKKILKMEV